MTLKQNPLPLIWTWLTRGLFLSVTVLLMASCQTSSSSSSSSSTSTASPQSSQTASSTSSSSAPQSQQSPQSSSTQRSGEQGNESSSENRAQAGTSGDEQPSAGQQGAQKSTSSAEDTSAYGDQSGGDEEGSILSEEEAVAVLDEQFEESIAVFDGMIINERASAQASGGEFPDDESGYDEDDGPLFEEADITEDSDNSTGGSTGDAEGGAQHGDEDGPEAGDGTLASNRGGINTDRPGGPVPSDIPDGSDDDIVARQIREAAMKEKDPVLREKLWEEYRKYKQGQ